MEYKLTEIKEWYKSNSELIPEIQRDLVWAPKQIVMLWDSILRGFPIGSFIIVQNGDGKLQILDGQQRINAIAQGFGTYVCSNEEQTEKKEPDLVLWLDLDGKVKETETKLFPLMITTKSHPWGYDNNDECSKLSSEDRRNSLMKFYGNNVKCEMIYNIDISLYDTWPYKAKMPIPLHIILNHINEENEEEFANMILEEFKTSKYSIRLETNEEWLNHLKKYHQVFFKLNDYTIGNPTISNSIFESNRNDLEILFQRINRGGTNITEDDLAYSTIKAYFGGEKIKSHDSAVINFISPAKLARLIFRIVDSLDKDSFVGNFDEKKIRVYSKNEDFKKRISEYYNNIEHTIKLIESVFDECNIPKVLRVEIANKTTELYMLLVYLAIQDKNFCKNSRFICGFIFYLKWFCDNQSLAVNTIKKHIKNKDFEESNFKSAISEIIGLNILTPLIFPDQLNNLFKIEVHDNWTPSCKYTLDFWNRIKENVGLLLFYQRDFINRTFKKYNPTNSKLWDDNCPWDYDHIVPQNWFCNYSNNKPFARFNKDWKDNIGNKAAIPFEINRAKSDKAEWEYYKAENLLNKEVIDTLCYITPEFNSNRDMAESFANFSFRRCCSIYEDCYKTLFKQLSLSHDNLTPLAKERKEKFEEIQKKTNNCHFYYVTRDYSRELPVESSDNWEWNMPWMSCGVIIKGIYYVALTCYLDYKNDNGPQLLFEIGIRRCPENLTIEKDFSGQLTENLISKGQILYKNNEWWYVARDIDIKKELLNTDEIVKELIELASIVENDSNK